VRRAVESRKLRVESLAAFLFVFLLASGAPQRVAAQFIGYTSPQTVAQRVFTNLGAAGTSSPVQNLGQTVHYLYYTVAPAPTAVEVVLEADTGGGWFEISNTATAFSTGIVFASGYYPLVRVNVKVLAGAGVFLNAWYSGTSTAIGPEAGRFRSSGTETVVVLRDQNAAADINFAPSPALLRSSEGVLVVTQTAVTGVTALTGAYIRVQISENPQGCGALDREIARFGPLVGGNAVQIFSVPSRAAARLCVSYNFAAAPTGGLLNVFYLFGPSALPSGLQHTFIALAAGGATEGLSVQSISPAQHTVQLTVTGGPANCTFQLEGSLDSTTGVDGTWFALSGAVDCTVAANRMFHVVNKPVPWVRGNLTALAGGAAPTVTFEYLGAR